MGCEESCFFQKQKPPGLPRHTPTHVISHQNRKVDYIVGGSLETQITLVNLGCIPIHSWGSRARSPHQPDWMVFDLDPTSGQFAEAAQAGLLLKEALDQLRLVGFPKTSGSRGLHVFVPLRRGPDYDQVLPLAKHICERVAASHPQELTVESRIEARKGRVYLDAFRNAFGATVVSPYSVRRRERAPVSMPLLWSQVTDSLAPSGFNVGNYQTWLTDPDPWKAFFRSRQSLGNALRTANQL